MDYYCLLTYTCIEELRKIQEERKILPLVIGSIANDVGGELDVCYDITNLVYYIQTNKGYVYTAYHILQATPIDTTFFILEEVADLALGFFPYLFSQYSCYFCNSSRESLPATPANTKIFRQAVYTYRNNDDLERIIEYSNSEDIPVVSFAAVETALKDMIDKLNEEAKLALVDLTSVSYTVEANKSFIYVVENYFLRHTNIRVIAPASQADVLLKYFPLLLLVRSPCVSFYLL